ncbi:MAG: D-isomer specific 2-hydroxyacid dehydrogenase, NAD-binding protein [Candidatus Giovannonibacteria bacterium GW2011_GWA2_53_7]|uniref:D-isomer specific 2-hydroxyacid dehydrogenase, NAD-binding protein n=1 Tax=Candidatus Giovannonibacteria bacterium GW2011_GWA2_53_7 TaxID=1618650 RepID=A0A0G2A6H1_9BACT|nr:MAG: D-isomer specific 2-hydroxyacid dehydrogenase, NAD-binding protein [Candidatus Giovannonibacteria bacterium GW2011_GWA2_53_7]
MNQTKKKFKKVVVLDTVIFYPEHRKLLNALADEVIEYPSSLPANLEKQYRENPELFVEQKCYTQIASDNVPLQLLMQRVEGADVIISCWTDIPDDILRLNPQLELIIFWTHEKEHRVNVRIAEELGIVVENIPDYGTDAVAEVVFAGMWQLILRNFSAGATVDTGDGLMHSVVNRVFQTFRKLGENEKNTRGGKFTHHFHKIGAAKFDFTQKHIDDLIPERLIAYRRIGFLDIANIGATIQALQTFGVLIQTHAAKNAASAEFYKFLCENDLVFYDAQQINPAVLKKMQMLIPEKIVDVRSLPSATYAIQNKTFGIVGLGRIGRNVARIAKGLGFRVIYASQNRHLEVEAELGIVHTGLEELMRDSDVVSVHVPAHHVENLINEMLIKSMKTGSLFINTADGNALDQHALTKRMAQNEVFAYLDVYPGLPRKDILGLPMDDPSDWKIHKLLTNHVIAYRAGWKTQESIRVKTYKLLGEMIDALNNA